MKNKKIVTLIATLGLMTCLYSKVEAVKFYDTLGTRYEGAVERLSELKIVNGVSDKVFNAEKAVTRAEFAKMLTEILLDENEFAALIIDDENCQYKDVSKNHWYYYYIVAASNYGLINGYSDNTFKPDKEVTYEEAAKMILKGLGHTYLREDHPDGWAKEYLEKMYEYRLTEGTSSFKEKEAATRGNIAIMIWNTLTTNIWEKISLNDVAGFTFIDSGETVFSQKFSDDYTYIKKAEIKDVKEINGKLHVRIGNKYYRFEDQEVTFNFSMLGGKATALLHKIKDEKGNVEEEVIIGLSSDIGFDLYEGTFKELSDDDFSYAGKIFRVGTDANYGYLLYNTAEEEVDRVVAFNNEGKNFYIDNIKINEKKEETEDDEEVEEDDEENKNTEETIIKTITLNDEAYTIADGAVLFQNNKRVNWNTIKVGDVITEVRKDKYYILTRETVKGKIEKYEKKSKTYVFSTSKGDFTSYANTQYTETLSTKTIKLNNISKQDLEKLIGKEVEFTLDFSRKIVRMEYSDTYTETELLKDISVGYFCSMDFTSSSNDKAMIRLNVNGNERVYRSNLTKREVEYGDLVTVEFDDNKNITAMKKVNSSAELNEKMKIKELSYRNLMDRIDDDGVTEETVIYQAIYEYDFGAYDEIESFEVKKINFKEIEEEKSEQYKIYAITDAEDEIQMILMQDYSRKKDIFYGRVVSIYQDKDDAIRIQISVLGDIKNDFAISGLLNCEEGDLISFKRLDESKVKILEKYTPEALGYYKDIIVEDVSRGCIIETEYGTFDLEDEKIIIENKEYLLSDYVYIWMRVGKDEKGNWKFIQLKHIDREELKLQAKDRIAINEIENTFIIYTGYTEL